MSKLLEALAGMKGAQFASFVYTAKPSGPRLTEEKARHVIILGADTASLYRRDLEVLAEIAPTLTGLEADAAELIAESRRVSLAVGVGHNPAYTAEDAYTPTGVKGVKIHNVTGDYHVNGLAVRKDVEVAATYRPVKSKPETLARQAVEARLPSAKFRQFKLSGITTAKLNGDTIELG
jgi:hypothetical protein